MPFEIIKPGVNFDFIGKWRLCLALSLGMILVSAALIPVRGIRLGIDFAGGTEIQIHFLGEIPGRDEGDIRSLVGDVGVAELQVVRYGDFGENEFLIRIPGGAEEGEKGELVDAIRATLAENIGPLEVDRVEFVGPRVGAELRRDGIQALSIAAFLILIYVGFRFSLRFAPGAVVALLHDVLITAGIFVMLGMEFDLRVLAALLAIIGYSLNDTIIVYDRIRENLTLHTSLALPEVLNRSVNQTLSRTLLTSGTTMAAVLALLFLGGEVIRPFAVAMAIGIVVGTYSSVYIASPMLLFLVQRFGTGEAGAAPRERKSKPAESPRGEPRKKDPRGRSKRRKRRKTARG